MSLSQKHAGLILVPWFNSDEWRYVYRLVYSYDKEKQLKALEVLKIWKQRTPILSTGVEGTLILLDAMIINTDSLSDEQISNLYAVALMRFLNLSAANSEKQGSFTRTSAKNELPKWLTNLRHDIAHGHQIPSKYNLKMGLDFGFNWLKEKYWEPQSQTISDYHIGEDSDIDDTVISSMEIYIDINMHLFEQAELDVDFYEKIKNIVFRKYKRKNLHPYLMLEIFLEMIAQSLEKDYCSGTISNCFKFLVSSRALLKPNFIISDEKSNISLDEKFVNIWANLLNVLHQYRLLFSLVTELFNVIGNISHTDQTKKMASLWINQIILALQNLRKENLSKENCMFVLKENKCDYTEQSKEFQKKVLHVSSENTCFPYVVDFLDNLLKYNQSSDEFSLDVTNLLKVNSEIETLHTAGNKIFTLEDLNAENVFIEEAMETTNLEDNNCQYSCGNNNNNKQVISGNKWKKIEDTSIFQNCPLGVLPHQIGAKHPLLILV